MGGEAWWAAVHGVTGSRTRLSNFNFTFHLHALEKEMETHSSVLAWSIPGTGKSGGLPSMGSHRVGHNWSNSAAAAAAAEERKRVIGMMFRLFPKYLFCLFLWEIVWRREMWLMNFYLCAHKDLYAGLNPITGQSNCSATPAQFMKVNKTLTAALEQK